MSTEGNPDTGETQLGSYDGFRFAHESADVYDVLQCSYDHFRTLGECETCLIVCPRASTSGQCDVGIKEIFKFGGDRKDIARTRGHSQAIV